MSSNWSKKTEGVLEGADLAANHGRGVVDADDAASLLMLCGGAMVANGDDGVAVEDGEGLVGQGAGFGFHGCVSVGWRSRTNGSPEAPRLVSTCRADRRG